MKRPHIRACADIVAASEPWITLQETVDFNKYIARKEAYVCILRQAGNDQVAGFLVVAPEPVFARGGYLRAIGVSPSLRRHRIGSALLAFAEKMVARQAPNIYLCVSSFNRQGRAFYKNQGYTKVGTLSGLTSPNTSEYIYRKHLAPACAKKCTIQRERPATRTGSVKGKISRP